ncbi:hypothetical protein AMELA_G00140780, partial [Ameiurus melas]
SPNVPVTLVGWISKSISLDPDTKFEVNQQGNFGQEQKEDDRLKHCWAQVQQIEGVEQDPDQRLPSDYFLVWGGLLYQRACRRGELMDLMVPKTPKPKYRH